MTVDLDGGTATGPYIGADSVAGFEDVLGSAHDDTLGGDAGTNVMAVRAAPTPSRTLPHPGRCRWTSPPTPPPARAPTRW